MISNMLTQKSFCLLFSIIGYMCKYTENFSIFDFVMIWGQFQLVTFCNQLASSVSSHTVRTFFSSKSCKDSFFVIIDRFKMFEK